MSHSLSSLIAKREKDGYSWPMTYEDIEDLDADKSEERDREEKAYLRKVPNFMCIELKLPWVGNLDFNSDFKLFEGHAVEEEFRRRVPMLTSHPIVRGRFKLFAARLQGDAGHPYPSIVDFIALDRRSGNWFPVDFKVGKHGDSSYVKFRNRYQALALYKYGGRAVATAKRNIHLDEDKRHAGLIIRREAITPVYDGPKKNKKILHFINKCKVFAVV